VLLPGGGDDPEAFRFRFDPCPSVYAHMHLTAQFQVLLAGSMDMPRGSMNLRPLSVHYTDHQVPYGPFSTGAGHDMLVLHPRAGGLVSMAHADFRSCINLTGRLLVGEADDDAWQPLPGGRGLVQVLIPAAAGPEVVLVELGAHEILSLPGAPFGRYDVVVAGAIQVGTTPLGPPGLRYVVGDAPAEPLVTGPEGATILTLAFDAAARDGGVRDDVLGAVATRAMAEAI
jgi:hypothetical protein